MIICQIRVLACVHVAAYCKPINSAAKTLHFKCLKFISISNSTHTLQYCTDKIEFSGKFSHEISCSFICFCHDKVFSSLICVMTSAAHH